MKKCIYLTIIIFTLISCKKEINITKPDKNFVTFIGTWSRDFDVLGNLQTAKYTIKLEQIDYKLTGLHTAEYSLKKDSYNEEDGRWIGHNIENNQYYVLFFKNVEQEEITIYKQKINDPNNALDLAIPPDDTEKNYGWNKYQLQ